jgi:copper transport protein
MTAGRRLLAVAAMTVAALIGLALPASAHALLEESSPVAGGTVAVAPRTVTLTFDESVGVEPGSIEVFDPTGRRVDNGDSHHGAAGSDVVIDLHPGLPKGTYVVSWRAVSADSHPVAGGFTFGIGVAPDPSAVGRFGHRAGSAVVGWADGIARFVTEAGVALAIGGGAFLLGLWPEGLRRRGPRRLLWGAVAATAAGALGLLLLEGPYGAGLGAGAAVRWPVLSQTLHSHYGHLVVLRLILLALAVPLLRALGARSSEAADARLPRLELAVIGLAVAVTVAGAGHAGTGGGAWLATTSLTLHIAAASIWIGGITLLAAFLLRRDDAPLLARIMPRWSTVAATSVAVVVLTGIYQAWREIGPFAALTATAYGRLLLVKIGLFAAMVGSGWFANRWVADRYRARVQAFTAPEPTTSPSDAPLDAPVEPPLPARRAGVGALRRVVAAETTLAGAVLVVTALLINAQPGGTAYAPPVARTVATGPLTLRIRVDPTRRGAETMTVAVADHQGRVQTVEQVTGTLTLPSQGIGPLTVPFTRTTAGHAAATGVQVPFPGRWQLAINIQVDDFDEYSATLTYQVR